MIARCICPSDRASPTELLGYSFKLALRNADGAQNSLVIDKTLVVAEPAVVLTTAIANVGFVAGDSLRFRVQTVGHQPATLRAKVWTLGTTEPSNWLEATDDDPAVPADGGIGVFVYVSSNASDTMADPTLVRVDDFLVTGL